MKTPSSLALLVLFAALPAAAQLKTGERCDAKWLEESQATLSQAGRTVVDGRLKVEGNAVRLVFGDPKTCDAATWRHLAVESPVGGDVVLDPRTRKPVNGTYMKWRSQAAEAFWKDANVAQQIGLVLVVNDSYAAIDAKTAAVNAAGDAVLDAAKALGIVVFMESQQPLADLAVGSSGGRTGQIKPRLVTVENHPAALPPDQLGPTMRKLVIDGGGLGDAVIAFRVAVLELQLEIGRQSNSVANLKKRVTGASEGLRDFTAGVPKGFTAVPADPTVARDDAKYKAALAALAGAEPRAEFKDQGLSKAALLDSVDQGARNLVAIRSAEVDKIHAEAVKRLGKKTLAEFESAARSAAVVTGAGENTLAAATFKALSGTPEYMRLDTLYENNKARQGNAWVNSTEGKSIAAAREEMKAAALTATIEADPATGRKQVVYTHNGVKTVLSGLVPSTVESSAEARAGAAAIISRSIIEGALDQAKEKAVLAAVRGEGQPGVDLPSVAPGTLIGPKDIPPATKKIKDGAAGCKDPKDLVRNDYETYAARQNAKAAEMASANVRSRGDVEKWRLAELTAADKVCKEKKAAAAGIKQDYFDDPAVANGQRERAGAAADKECADAKQAIEDAAKKKIDDIAAAEKGDRDPAKVRKAADDDLAAGFAVAVDGSVDALKADYLKAGSLRQKKLADLTGNSAKLAEYTGMYFAEAWPQDVSQKAKRQQAIADCAKALGLGGGGSYKNPDNPDNVDKYCKVNEGLLAYIASKKGTNRPAQ